MPVTEAQDLFALIHGNGKQGQDSDMLQIESSLALPPGFDHAVTSQAGPRDRGTMLSHRWS